MDDRLNITVLGHSGFIGRALCRKLVEKGVHVQGASSQECNLVNPAETERFLGNLPQDARVVLCSTILRTVEDSYDAMGRNIRMMENFVTFAPRGRLAGVVFFSTVDVYGFNPELPITERTRPAPGNFYGISKLTSEFLLRMPGALDCPLTVLRMPGIYGPGDRGRSIVGRFLDQIRRSGKVTICGDGSVWRDYVEVSDVCEVVLECVKRPFDGLFNVATGTSLSILEIVEILGGAVGISPTIEYLPSDRGVAGSLVFDITSFRSRFPNKTFKKFQEGAASYVAGGVRRDVQADGSLQNRVLGLLGPAKGLGS